MATMRMVNPAATASMSKPNEADTRMAIARPRSASCCSAVPPKTIWEHNAAAADDIEATCKRARGGAGRAGEGEAVVRTSGGTPVGAPGGTPVGYT